MKLNHIEEPNRSNHSDLITVLAMASEEEPPSYKDVPENSGAPPPIYPTDLAAEEARPVSSIYLCCSKENYMNLNLMTRLSTMVTILLVVNKDGRPQHS